MSFSNLFFPFVFLPISLLLYVVMPKKGKNIVLLVCSLVFFAWGTPEYILLLILSILFNYCSGSLIAAQVAEGKSAKFTLWTAVIANLLLLGFYKYYGFLLDNVNAIFHTGLSARALPAPIGVSFFTFSILSYLFDVYRGKAPEKQNLLDFSLYVTFFPKLVSGPIVQYKDFAPQIKDHPMTKELLGNGARRFVVGLAKKVLIANTLGATFYSVSALPMEQVSVMTAWLGAIGYTLMLYFDFSGYSDMAIGIAEMFGFRIDKNFDYPYLSGSITEFWRRWHISLGAWFRDYVYIPLGGSREGDGKTIRNLLIVWLLTGIWHGANWTFIVWGLYHGLLLLLEKFLFKAALDKTPQIVKRILTLLLVVIGWVFFFSDSLGMALSWIGRMFGAGHAPFLDAAGRYYWGAGWFVLLLAMVGSTPLPATVGNNLLRSRSKPMLIGCTAVLALLFILCIAGMMSDTYSSFLYFQF